MAKVQKLETIIQGNPKHSTSKDLTRPKSATSIREFGYAKNLNRKESQKKIN
jgi:hypothetical protein